MASGKPDINEMLAKLRVKYVGDLPDKLDEIEDSLMAVSRGNASEEAMLELYRRVHSVKGSAGSYGVPIVSAVCHRFEDRITQAQEGAGGDGGPPFVDEALRFVDLLREAVALARAGADDVSEIEEKLDLLNRSGPAAAEIGQRRISVLLLDDTRTTALMLRAALKDAGAELAVATDDLSALERLMNERFDILVCGLRAGRLGGLGVIAALKLSQGRSRAATAVLLTTDPAAVPAVRPEPDIVMGRGPGMAAEMVALAQRVRGAEPS